MRTSPHIVFVAVLTLFVVGMSGAAFAQQPWSAMPGACASTDNNFYNGVPSADFPVARFITPGGSFTFNRFHDGYIAVLCAVDNPRYSGTQRWNELQVTYKDPDGLRTIEDYGLLHQAYVELVRVSKTTGAWSLVARFDSNLQCQPTPTSSCGGNNAVKTFTVPFTHTFDFVNYTYAVYGRLYRGFSTLSARAQLYQLRLQAAPVVSDTVQ
jgi:hypothetical protein